MPSETCIPLLDDYLGRVRAHLPVFGGTDILRELESSIRDRIDDMAAAANRDPDEEIVRRALAEIGEPEAVADAYIRQPGGFGPWPFRTLAVYTAFVFAAHLVLVGVATTLERPLNFGPIGVAPVGSQGLVSLAAAVVHALLLDTGLMVFVALALGLLRRKQRRSASSLRVDTAPRAALGRAMLAVLVGVMLVGFRDRLFVVVNEGVAYPLFTDWFGDALPYVVTVLALSVVSDVLYACFGERRATVAVDAAHGIAGVACMLLLLRGDAILTLPELPAFAQFHDPVCGFLDQLGTFVVAFLALAFALKTVRRAVRFAQL